VYCKERFDVNECDTASAPVVNGQYGHEMENVQGPSEKKLSESVKNPFQKIPAPVQGAQSTTEIVPDSQVSVYSLLTSFHA
jgi:hypothetical protein